jgi:hypothetical protein
MKYTRLIVYKFLKLPYNLRLKVVQELKLVKNKDKGLYGMELFKRCFKRAKEQKIIEKLKINIDQKIKDL